MRIAANPKAVAAEAEIVISIITEDTACGRSSPAPTGFLTADVKGKLFIEMSTLQPMTGRELAPIVEAKGARLIESPVLGTIPSCPRRQAVLARRRARRGHRRARAWCSTS